MNLYRKCYLHSPSHKKFLKQSFWLIQDAQMLGSPRVGCAGVAVASSIFCAWSAAQPIPHQLLPMQKINETKVFLCFLTLLARVRSNHRKKIFGVGAALMGPSISVFPPVARASFSNFCCSGCFVFPSLQSR